MINASSSSMSGIDIVRITGADWGREYIRFPHTGDCLLIERETIAVTGRIVRQTAINPALFDQALAAATQFAAARDAVRAMLMPTVRAEHAA